MRFETNFNGLTPDKNAMIKKVKVEQLRPGIFVHDFNCDWKTGNHILDPSKINSTKIIDILISWGIKEVYIDTDRGLDVSEAKTSIELNSETDKALQQMAAKKPKAPKNIPLREELAVAKNIKRQATTIINTAMGDAMAGKPVETEGAYGLIEEMDKSITRNRDALVLLTRIRNKDEYTLMHSISVGAYILNYCNTYKLPHQLTMNLAIGGLFHDIGKTKIPLNILNKPGKLTDEEFTEMKRHAEYSAAILKDSNNLPEEACDIALHHHERYDGNGYPHGLKGDEITFGSQLAAIADVYDALTSDRCYKKGIDRVEGLRKLYEWSEFHFNKDLTYKFIRCIGVYPIGTCVQLASERIGVVIGSTENVIQPIVRIFYDNRKKLPMPTHDLDLSTTEDKVVKYEDGDKWDIKKMHIFEDAIATEILPA